MTSEEKKSGLQEQEGGRDEPVPREQRSPLFW